MKNILAILLTTFISAGLFSQTYIDPVDNTDLESNSHYIINPGVYSVADAGNDGILRINDQENIIIDATGEYNIYCFSKTILFAISFFSS